MNKPKPAMDTESLNFLELFLAKRNLDPYYTTVRNSFSNKVIYDKEITNKDYCKKKTIIIKDVPAYLEMAIPNESDDLKIRKINTYKGYAIDLKSYNHIHDYLNQNFGKASRSKLRRYQNRLENCFNISYKMHYGEISKTEFIFLFDALKSMLEKRFKQKKEENYELQNWEKYQNYIFPLINSKKASIFVIYHDTQPIDICVNLIYDKIIYSNISSYDIDYAAFSMGSIDMIKLIEWCIDNQFETIDLLKGYYYYKQKWINIIYDYQNHFIYDSASVKSLAYGNFKAMYTKHFYNIFHILKQWKLDEFYHNLKRKLYTSHLPKIDPNQPTTSRPLETKQIPPLSELKVIALDNSKYHYLRKTLYDFLYTSHETISSIKILEYRNSQNTFIFQGKTKNLEVVYPNPTGK